MRSQNHLPEPNWHMLDFLHPILLHIPSTVGDALSLCPILSLSLSLSLFFFQNLELAVQGPETDLRTTWFTYNPKTHMKERLNIPSLEFSKTNFVSHLEICCTWFTCLLCCLSSINTLVRKQWAGLAGCPWQHACHLQWFSHDFHY
jgi:hypothetical protein